MAKAAPGLGTRFVSPPPPNPNLPPMPADFGADHRLTPEYARTHCPHCGERIRETLLAAHIDMNHRKENN